MEKEFKYVCALCGKEHVKKYKSKGKKQFCSYTCRQKFYQYKQKICNCKFCGQEFVPINSQQQYCSYKCKYEQSKISDIHYFYQCTYCGKTIDKKQKKHGKKHFCSLRCQGKYRTLIAKIQKKCEWCGKLFTVVKNKKQKFCCVECQNQWQSNLRKRTKMPKITSIQSTINTLLQQYNISFICEQKVGYYCMDNYLFDYDIYIENMGEYWHTDIRKYSKFSMLQFQNILRDKRKNTYIQNHNNYKILYLWEEEINTNIELCKQLILLLIQEGKLENYHSCNYILEDGKIKLKSNIIVPYMERPIEEIKISLND